MNIYTKLLLLLNANQGYQNIEPFFTENNINDYESKSSILQELSKLDFINYQGGLPPAPMFYVSSFVGENNFSEPEIKDFCAIITILILCFL